MSTGRGREHEQSIFARRAEVLRIRESARLRESDGNGIRTRRELGLGAFISAVYFFVSSSRQTTALADRAADRVAVALGEL